MRTSHIKQATCQHTRNTSSLDTDGFPFVSEKNHVWVPIFCAYMSTVFRRNVALTIPNTLSDSLLSPKNRAGGDSLDIPVYTSALLFQSTFLYRNVFPPLGKWRSSITKLLQDGFLENVWSHVSRHQSPDTVFRSCWGTDSLYHPDFLPNALYIQLISYLIKPKTQSSLGQCRMIPMLRLLLDLPRNFRQVIEMPSTSGITSQ